MSKRRKKGGDGVQEGGSEGETQADSGTERTDDVDGHGVVPGRGNVSSSTTVGEFWEIRNGAFGLVNMDQGI